MDPFLKAAREVADDVERLLAERPLEARAVSLVDYGAIDRAFFDEQTAILLGLGFRLLQDLDATPVMAAGTPPVPIRVLLDAEGTTSAALTHAIPRSPGLLVKWLLKLFGSWHEVRAVEFTTYVDDEVVSTSNVGELDFSAAAPWRTRRAEPLSTPTQELLRVHRQSLAGVCGRTGSTPRRFDTFASLFAAREDNRVRTNAWRREIGGLLPAELDRLLAPHGKGGERVRPHLERELRARNLLARAATL